MGQPTNGNSVFDAWVYLEVAIGLISGIGILKGQNWARVLYVAWTALPLVINFAMFQMNSIPLMGTLVVVLYLLIISFILFRPKANEYFST